MKLETRIKNIKTNIDGIIDRVNDGHMSPLDAFVDLKRIDKMVADAMNEIKSDAMDEALKHGKGEHLVHGAFVSVKNVGGRWDFKHLSDWANTKQQLTDIEKKYKSAYKSHENGLMNVDEKSGEIQQLPKYNAGSEALTIKLPKI